MRILAITPARGGSKGVPKKNIKLLNGKPLLQYTVDAVKGCPFITRYIVNTEDKEIEKVAKSLGAETQNRPKEFWFDNTIQEVDRLLQWSVKEIESKGEKIDVVVLLYATSPFRQSQSITDCINLIVNKGLDSSLTLFEDRSYLWKRLGDSENVIPTNYNPKTRGPNQMEKWNQWVENKAVYAMKRDLLLESGCRLGGKIGFVRMNKLESIDIDTIEDFILAERILNLK